MVGAFPMAVDTQVAVQQAGALLHADQSQTGSGLLRGGGDAVAGSLTERVRRDLPFHAMRMRASGEAECFTAFCKASCATR